MKLQIPALMAAMLAISLSTATAMAQTTVPSSQQVAVPVPPPETAPGAPADLRELIGVNPGMKRVLTPRLPTMSLKGYIDAQGRAPIALLEMRELNRLFVVEAGTEIPIMVNGRVTPVGQSELGGLHPPGNAPVAPAPTPDAQEQSQVILKVVKVTAEGVIIETGVMARTIIVR